MSSEKVKEEKAFGIDKWFTSEAEVKPIYG